MTVVAVIVSVLAVILLLSTLICGLWIRSKGLNDPQSKDFHTKIGIAAVIFGAAGNILTLVLFLAK